MSDTVSVRIDLGNARVEFAGVVIDQPIGITLDLPRQKIAEMILGGGVLPPLEPAVEEERRPLIKPRIIPFEEKPADPEAKSDRRKSSVTSLGDEALREKLSSMSPEEAASDLGIAVQTVYAHRKRLGLSHRNSKMARFGEDYLREKLQSMTTEQAMAEFGVSKSAIYQRCKILGIDTIKTERRRASSEETDDKSPVIETEAPNGDDVVEKVASVTPAPKTTPHANPFVKLNLAGRKRSAFAEYGNDWLRDKLSNMSVEAAAKEFGVSSATVYNHRRRLGIPNPTDQRVAAETASRVEGAVANPISFTDYSDIELRKMLSSRQWSSIALEHNISITAVIAEAKRLGVPQPQKSDEVPVEDATFRGASSQEGTRREADEDA